jgi:flotillin
VTAMKAQYYRDAEIKKAGFLAETEEAKARAAQAGPLAQAQASQQVIEQQTALASRQADLAAQRLEAEVRRPADAEAYRKRAIAEADRDQAKLAAEAEAYRNTTLAEARAAAAKVEADATAYAQRVTAEGEADANKAKAASLRAGNQQLIAASRLIEQLPALVEAAAGGLSGSNLTVLNGAQGVNEMLAGLVGQGLSILELLKNSTAPAGESQPVELTTVAESQPVEITAVAEPRPVEIMAVAESQPVGITAVEPETIEANGQAALPAS